MVVTLLLNSTYECISFISERKAFKLLAKGKVEVLSSWEEQVIYGCDPIYGNPKYIGHPAVLILKHHVRWIPRKVRFNRTGVFKRDKFKCQYCGVMLTPSKLTIDHVLPVAQGGDSSWRNCVASCFECNNKKGDKTPEQARMPLACRPRVPMLDITSEYFLMKRIHQSWKQFIPDIKD